MLFAVIFLATASNAAAEPHECGCPEMTVQETAVYLGNDTFELEGGQTVILPEGMAGDATKGANAVITWASDDDYGPADHDLNKGINMAKCVRFDQMVA